MGAWPLVTGTIAASVSMVDMTLGRAYIQRHTLYLQINWFIDDLKIIPKQVKLMAPS